MADRTDLHNSYGPELNPYQNQPGLEYYAPPPQPKELEKDEGAAPEVVPALNTGAPKHKKILGLRVALFWTVAALALLVVLGVGIGVGVGVGAKHGSSSTPASTETASSDGQSSTTATSHSDTPSKATSTSSTSVSTTSTSATSTSSAAAVTSGTHGEAGNSCTSTSPKTYHGPDGVSFTEYCYTDWPNNSPAADGHGNVSDVSRTTVYTFEDCMDACVAFNKKPGTTGTPCIAVTYNSNLTNIIEVGRQGGNCFLKNKKGVDLQGSAESACAAMAF